MHCKSKKSTTVCHEWVVSIRGVASSKQVRGPQHNMMTIANVNQDIETMLKQDKSEGAMAPLGTIAATPVVTISDMLFIHKFCNQ